jgi:hypothetical protein
MRTQVKPFFFGADMRKTYAEKLKDPRWQKLRLLKLDDAGWLCQSCGDKDKTLHVHHNWYVEKKEPWEYEIDQLTVLCPPCHDRAHKVMGLIQDCLSRIDLDGPENLEAVMWFLIGLKMWDMEFEDIDEPWKKKAYDFGRGFVVWDK